MEVVADYKDTGKSGKITITNDKGRLREEQIERTTQMLLACVTAWLL